MPSLPPSARSPRCSSRSMPTAGFRPRSPSTNSLQTWRTIFCPPPPTRSPKERPMRIGILGSGLMGGKLGTLLARAGHDVDFSYSRSPAKLKKLARDAGGKGRATTPAEAVKDADVVLLAVHWSRLDDVLGQAG